MVFYRCGCVVKVAEDGDEDMRTLKYCEFHFNQLRSEDHTLSAVMWAIVIAAIMLMGFLIGFLTDWTWYNY